MKRIDQQVAEAMLAAPNAATDGYPGGMVALRRAVECSAGELRDAVQRMRWAGKVRMDALQLTASMLPAGKPPTIVSKRADGGKEAPPPRFTRSPSPAKAGEEAPPPRFTRSPSPAKAGEEWKSAKEAEAEITCSAAEGAGAGTTAAPAPEAKKTGSAGDRRPADGARPLPAPAPEAGSVPPPPPPAQIIDAPAMEGTSNAVRQCETILHRRGLADRNEARGRAAGGAPVAPRQQAEVRRDGAGRDVRGFGARGVADSEAGVAPQPKAGPRSPAAPSWVERHLARRDAARAFLAGKGRHPFRCGSGAELRWQVPGWSGSYGDHDLISIAQEYGFEKEASSG